MSKTWIEISRTNFLHNIKQFRSLVGPDVKMGLVIKANAYGHGLEKMVNMLENEKVSVDWYIVDRVSEAIEIRELGSKDTILVIGYTPKEEIKKAVENDISLTIYDQSAIDKIVSLDLEKRAKVHIKIETGFYRQGVSSKKALELAKKIKSTNAIELEGISSHFAEATKIPSPFTKAQIKRFKEAIKQFQDEDIFVPITHIAASAGVLTQPDSFFDMVRLGIGLYGIWPSSEVEGYYRKKYLGKIELKPVLSWKTKVAQVKRVPKGEGVGYGKLWKAPIDSKIAIIPIGYSDGYNLALTDKSKVIINKKLVSVIGRVAMNMILADVTKAGQIKEGDEVVLIGKSGSKKVSVTQLAEWSDSVPHEVVARLNSNIERVVVSS